MDNVRFDALTRTFSTTGTRRGLLCLVAALPLAGTLAALLGEESEAGRRRRRKARHDPGQDKDHRKGKRKGKGKGKRKRKNKHTRQNRQPGSASQSGCVSESKAQTCAGTCGSVTNTCGTVIDCGPCACNPTCPICQTCDASTGACIPDLNAAGDACGTCRECDAMGQCAAVLDDTPCDDGDLCTQTDTCQNGVCVGSNPVVCNSPNECQTGPGTCNPATGACSYPNKTNRTACSGDNICCNGTCCDGCCGSDGSCGACLVFVTSTTYDGNLGGLSGADGKCQVRAIAGSLPGTYKAWLSTGTGAGQSPATGRFRQSAQPYLLVNGDPVATSWADLVDGTDLANPIGVTELGGLVGPGQRAWTQTKPDGTAGGKSVHGPCGTYSRVDDCQDWESTAEMYGSIGHTGAVDCHWTATGLATCDLAVSRHLYCFQQD